MDNVFFVDDIDSYSTRFNSEENTLVIEFDGSYSEDDLEEVIYDEDVFVALTIYGGEVLSEVRVFLDSPQVSLGAFPEDILIMDSYGNRVTLAQIILDELNEL